MSIEDILGHIPVNDHPHDPALVKLGEIHNSTTNTFALLSELDAVMPCLERAFFLVQTVTLQEQSPNHGTDLLLSWGAVCPTFFNHLEAAHASTLKIRNILIAQYPLTAPAPVELDAVQLGIESALHLAGMIVWKSDDLLEMPDLTLAWSAVAPGLLDHIATAFSAAREFRNTLAMQEVTS
ncbi:MAG: hypothetical protein HQL52_19740 [Magnetococcales bacterium]|nr:hypothetical protein [Magnetococcales bacterium]